ncbi:hypothetical protein SBI67_17035 [Mycolicibacterium sp. 120266]|uniref:hypothetical protein n=1 Tax=Mycolicibacterium sp. 120266 TaxID=3090601 RepID=UPI00299EF1A3|nr:hypothetical protein [Mycolicibacterium sp. 120266]MDX1873827.1 hypothetical protein [Mycolicibacterium sp. 120266]
MSHDHGAAESEDVESPGAEVVAPAVEENEPAVGSADSGLRSRRTWRTTILAGLFTAALAASAGLAAWLYLSQYRPDQQTDPTAQKAALEAATTGTVALLSYSPESLDKDFAAAKARLTGSFLSYYTQFTEQIVTPAAKQKSVKTSASVVRAAVSQMQPDKAQVLVFINQSTTSKENPDGAFAASSVRVGLTKIDGTWLIDAFDPV